MLNGVYLMAFISETIKTLLGFLEPPIEKNLSIINSEVSTLQQVNSESKELISLFGGEIIPFSVNDKPAVKESAEPEISVQAFPFSKSLTGNGIEVIDLSVGKGFSTLERKPSVQLLRKFAKNSTWVRAAINYKRDKIGRAHPEIVPLDSTQKPSRVDKRVRAEVEKLLRRPNEAGTSYGYLKEQMLEDYFVLGEGNLELELYNDLTVRGIDILDAAKIGHNKKWNGKTEGVPRYCEFSDYYSPKISRWLANEQVFSLINSPMSDSTLGLSHVEILRLTVLALLTSDDFLLNQVENPISEKLISLGEGVTPQQTEAFKYQMKVVRDKLAVIGGAKDPKVLNLSGSAEEMRILDSCEWFVRQVAAVFNISTAKLKLSVDTSRANTSEMMADDLEGLEADLTRIIELENSCFINRYSYLGEINLQFSYPIMHRKDEKQQALIAKQQTGVPWASINDARARTGEKLYDEKDMPHCNEPLVPIGKGQFLPYSVWVKWVDNFEKNIGKTPEGSNNQGDNQPDNSDQGEDENSTALNLK